MASRRTEQRGLRRRPGIRRLLAILLLHFPLLAMGWWEDREVLFAFPDADPVDAVYLWHHAVVTSGMPLSAAIHKAQANGGSEPMEIRLLNRQGAAETVYRLGLGSTTGALRWRGTADRLLTVRGQMDRSGARPRPLTVVVGRSLRETLCSINNIDVCALAEVDVPPSRDVDALDYLAGELNRRNIIKNKGEPAEDVK